MGFTKGIGRYLPQLAAAAALFALVATVVVTSRNMPMVVDGGSPGPRFMPLVLAVVLAVLTVWYVAETFIKKQVLTLPRLADMARPAAYVGLAVLVVLLWERLGAVPTVLLVSVLELKGLEGFGWAKALGLAVFLAAFTWLLFEVVLGTNLPLGVFKALVY